MGAWYFHGREYRVGADRVWGIFTAARVTPGGPLPLRPRPVCFRSISRSRPRSSPTRSEHNKGVRAHMSIEIRVPALGESITEATVGKWFRQTGETVKADEPLVELETDKVTVEVPAPASGVLGDILVKSGSTVAVGSLLAALKEGAAKNAATPSPNPQSIEGRLPPAASRARDNASGCVGVRQQCNAASAPGRAQGAGRGGIRTFRNPRLRPARANPQRGCRQCCCRRAKTRSLAADARSLERRPRNRMPSQFTNRRRR